MNNKEVAAIELVKYKTDDIEYTSAVFVRNFALYSGLMGVEQWHDSLVLLRDIITNQKPKSLVLPAEGIDVEFSGFKMPTPHIVEDQIIYIASEPRFTMFDRINGELILPSHRNKVEQVISDISEEMKDVYHLKVDTNPPTLIFPKEEYATVTIAEGVLI